MFYKSLEMEVKANSGKRTFAGYASKFGNVDLHNDIIEKGAFAKTIQEQFPKKGIKVFWQHAEPIGYPTVLQEDDDGLYVEGTLSKTRLADEAMELMRDGVVDGMSIGYDVIKDEEDENGIRHLKELKLYEVSVVTWGANPEAGVTNMKHLHALNSIFKDENLARIEEVKTLLDKLNDTLDGGVLSTKNGNLIVNAAELKAGRVLSKKNRDNLKNAMDLIQTVLKTADEDSQEKGLKLDPNEGESQDDFIERCMSSEQMIEEYEDEDQRYAVCLEDWDNQEDDEDELETDSKGIYHTEEFKSLLEEIRSYTRR